MTWNYRLVEHTNKLLYIHSVYYDKDGSPEAMNEEPEIAAFFDFAELEDSLQMWQNACKHDFFVPPESWDIDL